MDQPIGDRSYAQHQQHRRESTLPGRDDLENHAASCTALPALLTIDQVARLLNCSKRTVYRLTDADRMPRPVRLGSLLRWNRNAIEQWIAGGCPATR